MVDAPKLILLRHGQSDWNRKNIFTGWVDVPLSKEGVQEALEAGKKISHIPIDVIFISSLIRAQMTAFIAMSQHDEGRTPLFLHTGEGRKEKWGKIYNEEAEKNCIPVISSEALNERMYGNLQGINKDEARAKHGKEQVKIWRRSYKTAPPEGESLEMTAQRVIPYFKKNILPYLQKGNNVFISAHGNSLRSIIMYLDQLSEEEVLHLEIPTGSPICYSYVEEKWKREDIELIQEAYKKKK